MVASFVETTDRLQRNAVEVQRLRTIRARLERALEDGDLGSDRLAGAEIVWIDHDDWARQGEIYAREAKRLRSAGKTPYIIPEGGSNALGAWGYIDCARELAEQIGALPPKATTVIYACGSGGTGAGLILGGKQFGFADQGIKIAGVNVCDSREYFVRRIADIGKSFANAYQGQGIDDVDIDSNSGMISRLKKVDGAWIREDLIRGLPRSKSDLACCFTSLVVCRSSLIMFSSAGDLSPEIPDCRSSLQYREGCRYGFAEATFALTEETLQSSCHCLHFAAARRCG